MPKRNVVIATAAILGAGLLFLVSNLELPIVRNSFVYAKAAKNIIEHGGNPVPVIADTKLSHGKPIAFSLLSVPFVSILGTNAGLKVASFLGTAFFLCVAYFFFLRLNRRVGIDPRFIPFELALLFFNPLAFYQFWSAYPDSLFAGLVLLAFVLVDIIVVEHGRDTRALIFLLGLVIYAAILTKFYGVVLGIVCPTYLLLHLPSLLKHSTYMKSKIAFLVVVFSALGVAVVLARLGRNPTLNFGIDMPEGGGYSIYVAGLTDLSGGALISSIALFVFALLLNFHFSLFFLLRTATRAAWPLAPTFFAGIYFLALLPYPGTSYNMRFFLPLFPFVVVPIVSGMLNTKKSLSRAIFVAHVATASMFTLNYNVQSFYERLLPFNKRVAESVAERRWIDNLRLDQHIDLSKKIERINEVIEPGGVLYWASTYYGTATHSVVEGLGIRSDIVVQYIHSASETPPTENSVYLTGYRSRGSLSGVEERFAVRSVGSGVLRLTPLQIELTRPLKDHFDRGELILLEVRASASAEAQVRQVEFLIDGLPVAADTDRPFEFTWQGAREGRHVVTARVQDSEGNVALSAALTVFVGIRALERYIARSADDAEELPDGSMYLTSSDLELIRDSRRGEQLVGMRLTDIRIPRGAEIERAYLQFTADDVSTEQTDLIIQAELAGDGVPFRNIRNNLSSRKRTSASLRWSPEPWEMVGESSVKQRTPDLSALIQEVVDRPDWREGNALVLLIRGSGRRVAVSYDGARERTARLYVERR